MISHHWKRGSGYSTSRNQLIPIEFLRDAHQFWVNVQNAMLGDSEICWPWQGNDFENRYGRFRGLGAHRVAYFLHHEVQPGRQLVLHRCDNPPCCNPYHLFLGDHTANAGDRDSKGRGDKGSRAGGKKKLTLAQANEIKVSMDTAKTLAARYEVSKQAIYDIWQGRSWSNQ